MKIGIIGAGPSGLAMAISVKRKHPNYDVIVFEKMNKIGKKLLATGNGRANVSNAFFYEYTYNNNCFDLSLFDINNFFSSIGIMLKKDDEGRIYPYNEKASDVVLALWIECRNLGITFLMEEVIDLSVGFVIKTKKDSYYFDYVVLSTGGCSSENLGSNGSGYELAKKLGHHTTKLTPGLCPLISYNDYSNLAGLRTKCMMMVVIDGKNIFSELGEVLFKKDGISGIAAFQAASLFARKKYDTITLDFFPDYSVEKLADYINNAPKNRYVDEALLGMIDSKLLFRILEENNIEIKGKKIIDIDGLQVAKKLKEYSIKIKESYPFIDSQVTVGGICLEEIKPNFESKLVKNLFLIGEILDVDGLSGGYNLHFAFASGTIAGENI